MGENSWWALLKRLAKAYAAFSIAHVAFKILRIAYLFRRAQRDLKAFPGGNFEDRSGRVLLQNGFRIHDYFSEHVNKTPEADLVKGPGPNIEVFANSPAAVEWLLKTEFNNMTKPSDSIDYLFYALRQFIGAKGIFTLRHGTAPHLAKEHAEWRKQRKVTSLIFTKNNFLNAMRDTFCANSDKWIASLRKVAEKGEVVDMQAKSFAFTMDSIQKIFFGVNINTIDGQDADKYGQAFDTAHENMMKHLLHSIMLQLVAESFAPWPFGAIVQEWGYQHSLIMRMVRTRDNYFGNLRKNVGVLNEVCYEAIAKIRQDPTVGNRKDVLANFMNSKHFEGTDDKTLRDILLNLTIAGRDTTACALTWMFYMLTQNPGVQRRVQEEIDAKLGDKDPELEDLSPENMPYLNGVLYETLRLYPPVPLDYKFATRDTTFLDGKTRIMQNMRVNFSPYAMGRNPLRYPDPLKVDPTRWIPFKQPSLYEFPVFQAGPRFCLGKDMAQFEAKIVAAKLLRRFSFELMEGEAEKINYSLNITMSLCNSPNKDSYNLWIRPIPRTRSS